MASVKTVALVPAAGLGRRMGGDLAKQFLSLAGIPMLSRTLMRIEQVACVDGVVVAVPAGSRKEAKRLYLEPYGLTKVSAVVEGGATRQDSVANALEAALDMGADYILIHDAARPFAGPDLFEQVLDQARESGAAVAAAPCVDTVKQARPDRSVERTLDRGKLWLVQTPQGFKAELLMEAMEFARQNNINATDEAGLVEAMGRKVKLVPAPRENFKITAPEDLIMARGMLSEPVVMPLVGQGFDAHRLVEGRPLILAGVRIPHEKGLLGHSDADVLTHAVMDAVLAAAGLGDIGGHFPDTDDAYKGADSLELLKRVKGMALDHGLAPVQLSATLMAQKPKVAPFIITMRQNLARCLGLALNRVNLAATTTEGMGFVGKEEGMAASALATLAPAHSFRPAG